MRDLSYLGVKSPNPPNFKTRTRAPLTTDLSGVHVGDIWHQEFTANVWMLTSRYNNIATWTQLNNSGSSGLFTEITITTNDLNISLGDINLTAGDLYISNGGIKISAINFASTLKTLPDGTVYGLPDGSDLEIYMGSTGNAAEFGTLTSTGATVAITRTAGGINLEAAGGAPANTFEADDALTVAPTGAGKLFVLGGANVTTTAAIANTLTINADISKVDINEVLGTVYQLIISDAGKEIRFTNAAPVTLTIPTAVTVGFEIGTIIVLYQEGAGKVSIAPAGGVTIRSSGNCTDFYGQYSGAVLVLQDTNEWWLYGDLA